MKNKSVKGWIEILYRVTPFKESSGFLDILPLSSYIDTEFVQVDYCRVGSILPIEEFEHTLDIVDYYSLNDISNLYGIPRRMRAYDAFNLCASNGPFVRTFVVVPRNKLQKYKNCNPQHSEHNDLGIITPRIPFVSYLHTK